MRLIRSSILVVSVLGLTACASQRPLPQVRDDGQKAFERQQYDVALESYQEAVDRDPGDYRGQVGIAKVYMAIDNPQKAREHLEIARTTRPNDMSILELLCDSLVESGEHDDLYTLLVNDANQRQIPSSYIRLGKYTARIGDIDTAERALLTAARADAGRNASVQITLANFYEGIGDRDEAVRRLRMALYIEPDNEKINSKLRDFGEVPGPSLAIVPDEMDG